jgi:ankyrin repeat protein
VVERLTEKGAGQCERLAAPHPRGIPHSHAKPTNAACTLNVPSFTTCALSMDTAYLPFPFQPAHPTHVAAASPLAIIDWRATKETRPHAITSRPMIHTPLVPVPLSGSTSVTPPQDGRTPLHFAAERGFVGIIDKLLDMGADIDEKEHRVPIRRERTHLPSRSRLEPPAQPT